jgi:hypothetical protein
LCIESSAVKDKRSASKGYKMNSKVMVLAPYLSASDISNIISARAEQLLKPEKWKLLNERLPVQTPTISYSGSKDLTDHLT